MKAKPQFGKGMVPTPPVFFMNAEGKVLGEISNYAKSDAVLAKMLDILEKNPEFAKPSEVEKQIKDPIELANLRIDLQDYKGAIHAIAKVKSLDAVYLRGRIARFQRDWARVEHDLAALAKGSGKYAADARMEMAYKLWYASDFEGLRKHLAQFPKEHARYTEARYYEGLAAFHLKDKDAAMKIWESTIKACAQDPWVYRADWAYTQTKKGGGRGGFSSAGPRDSLLNRIGYMRNKNPDLKGPSAKP